MFYGWTDILTDPAEKIRRDFKPTFKVARDKVEETYNIKRLPAYTDRVLYKSYPGFRNNLKVTEFTSVPAFTTSDHKPVRAQFEVVPSLVPELTQSAMSSPRRHRWSLQL